MNFRTWLIENHACAEARKWVGDKTLAQAWAVCHRGDWMRWLSYGAARNESWTFGHHMRMVRSWDAFNEEFGVTEAACLVQGASSEGMSEEDLMAKDAFVDALYDRLQADFFRSVQPTPPPIPDLED